MLLTLLPRTLGLGTGEEDHLYSRFARTHCDLSMGGVFRRHRNGSRSFTNLGSAVIHTQSNPLGTAYRCCTSPRDIILLSLPMPEPEANIVGLPVPIMSPVHGGNIRQLEGTPATLGEDKPPLCMKVSSNVPSSGTRFVMESECSSFSLLRAISVWAPVSKNVVLVERNSP